MELCTKLIGMNEVEFVISKFRKVSKSAAEDVILTYNILCENNPELGERSMKYIQDTYVMCSNMEPDVEDVISMLLFRENIVHRASAYLFKQKYRENRYEHYYSWMAEACKNAPMNEKLSKDECISYYIMMRVCEKMFEDLIRTMNKKGVPDTICITQAYEMAYKAHYWDSRKSGEPYLVHPLQVANILAEVGVESQIIAAALLHDVAEDTDYTLDDIQARCGARIARYVDAVTSLHKEYAESHNKSEYQCDKYELDAKSFEKLAAAVSSDPSMVFALYIKAADRIHNLSTIDSMPSEKRHNKNDETELDYLPLFKKFKLNYFVSKIEDLMWRTSDIARYESINAKYLDMVERNYDSVEEMRNLLKMNFGEEFNRRCQLNLDVNGFDIEVIERKFSPYEVYTYIKDAVEPYAISEKSIDKKFVPICDFDVILDPRDQHSTLDVFATIFVKMFVERIADTGRTIVDFVTDSSHRFIVKIEDKYRNVFRCCFSTRDDYIAYRIGSSLGFVQEDDDDNEIAHGEHINVKLRNGKVIVLPKGATVIDVAFAIHEEIGFSAKSALINGQQASIYNMLQDGDQVIVEADTYRENGVTKKYIRHARISWLNSVATKEARKKIIKYLSNKYEGDDPRYESNVQDQVAGTSSGKYSETFRQRHIKAKK